MNRYLFICCLCISALGSLSTLNATSIFTYILINKTNTLVTIPDHNITLEKNAIFSLKITTNLLKNLVAEAKNDTVNFKFDPPLGDRRRIEFHEDEKDSETLNVLVFIQGNLEMSNLIPVKFPTEI